MTFTELDTSECPRHEDSSEFRPSIRVACKCQLEGTEVELPSALNGKFKWRRLSWRPLNYQISAKLSLRIDDGVSLGNLVKTKGYFFLVFEGQNCTANLSPQRKRPLLFIEIDRTNIIDGFADRFSPSSVFPKHFPRGPLSRTHSVHPSRSTCRAKTRGSFLSSQTPCTYIEYISMSNWLPHR